MTTRAQSWYIDANPDKSHNFIDNEDFEQFRDNLLIVMGMSSEKVDEEVVFTLPSKPKDNKLSPATIQRRSHNIVRDAVKRNKLSLLNIQRFLLDKLYYYSQQLEEEIDEELVQKWEVQIDTALKKLDNKSAFETLLGVYAKVLTLSPSGKTMLTYLGVGKKKQEEDTESDDQTDDSSDDTSGFSIPRN